MDLHEGYLQDIRNNFDDGYNLGKAAERKRITALIELDLLTQEPCKARILSMIWKDIDDDYDNES